ncbi:MAG: hypothetical protein ACLFN4_04030 [Candidatus Acetothermia bacterium]
MEANNRGNDYIEKLGKEGVIAVSGEPFYGGSLDAVRLSLVSVPFVESDKMWKENVDNLKRVIG